MLSTVTTTTMTMMIQKKVFEQRNGCQITTKISQLSKYDVTCEPKASSMRGLRFLSCIGDR